MFKEFNILRSSDLVNTTGVVPISVPDHSFISWSIDVPFNISSKSIETLVENSFVKYDVRNIPDNFFLEQEVVTDLHNAVFNLEASLRTQQDIDNSYKTLCSCIKSEMSEKLNKRNVNITNASSNKRRKIGKPWWNESLTALWNDCCADEKIFLKCRNVCVRKRLRLKFVKSRKLFNRSVQKCKRLY